MQIESTSGSSFGHRRWRTGIALAFALTYPTLLAWVYFVALAGKGQKPNLAFQVAYTGGKFVQFLLPLACVVAFERRWPKPAWPSFRGLTAGLAFGLIVALAIAALYFLALHDWLRRIGTGRQVLGKLREFGLDSPLAYLFASLFLAGVHSLLEEYYWRWFAFGWLKRQLPVLAAVVLSSLAFMAHHVVVLAVFLPHHLLTAVVPFSLCIAGGGAVWAWMYHRTGSIYSPWISHALVDLAILAVGYDLVFVSGMAGGAG